MSAPFIYCFLLALIISKTQIMIQTSVSLWISFTGARLHFHDLLFVTLRPPLTPVIIFVKEVAAVTPDYLDSPE
jgi:hypothetical protein